MGSVPKNDHFNQTSLDELMAKVNPNALSVDDLARLLTAAGRNHVTPKQVREDLERGAPVNADGTINLLNFTAWLKTDRNTSGS